MGLDLLQTIFISVVFVLVAGAAYACDTEYLKGYPYEQIDQAFEDYFGSAECTDYAMRCRLLNEIGKAQTECALIK